MWLKRKRGKKIKKVKEGSLKRLIDLRKKLEKIKKQGNLSKEKQKKEASQERKNSKPQNFLKMVMVSH